MMYHFEHRILTVYIAVNDWLVGWLVGVDYIFHPQGWTVGSAPGYFPSADSWVMVVVRIRGLPEKCTTSCFYSLCLRRTIAH